MKALFVLALLVVSTSVFSATLGEDTTDCNCMVDSVSESVQSGDVVEDDTTDRSTIAQ